MRRALIIVMALSVIWSGCGRKKRVRVAPPPAPSSGSPGKAPAPSTPSAQAPAPQPAPQVEVKKGMHEEGVASWYGNPYHGRASASGEIYDMEQMTAAHRTLPFQTWVRVHDLDNGKTVDVRINDRGPFVDGRIIDLSHAAARSIALIGPGTAHVRVEVIKVPADAPPARYAVQVGAFRDQENARRLRQRLEKEYGTARAVRRDGNPTVWRVLVGSETTESGAETLATRVREEQKVRAAFVVRLDL